MARKRNVDAESHLMTGGLITGFLTFMGCLPGAAASAAVTGSLVRNDIQKAKKQESFQRDFAAHQARCEEGRSQAQIELWRLEKIIEVLAKYDFDPNSEAVITQEKIERVFSGAKTTLFSYYNSPKNRKKISIEEMIELASNAELEKKTVELLREDGEPTEFILETEDGEVYATLGRYDRIPYNLRKVCNQWNIPFRKHSYTELEQVKGKIAMKLFAPYQFDYSKYR